VSAAPIVAFGEDWGRHPSSTQHLLGHLARTRRILYLNSVGLRRPRLADAGRVAAKLGAMLRTGAAQDNAADAGATRPEVVLSPPAVPLPGVRLARLANRRLWRHAVGGRARAMGLDRPILWTSLPTALDARHSLPHRALVYYCGDDFGALDGVDHAPVLRMEGELAAAADLIVISHPALAKKFDPAKTVLVPHGVDLARFAGLQGPDRATPPVAGFLGRLDNRLDYDAIARAAARLPGWTFRLVGPVAPVAAGAVAALVRLPNVEVPGPVAPATVPALIAGWTTALLPYRDTPMTRACDPLKLREYLAAGTPVAAFDIAGARAHAPAVTLCNPTSLVDALMQAAAEPASARAIRRSSVAADDWSARAATLSSLMERFG
jgi:glycosyltransferase involved in cell wall biosynthesis